MILREYDVVSNILPRQDLKPHIRLIPETISPKKQELDVHHRNTIMDQYHGKNNIIMDQYHYGSISLWINIIMDQYDVTGDPRESRQKHSPG
jgi:hypothetical protein